MESLGVLDAVGSLDRESDSERDGVGSALVVGLVDPVHEIDKVCSKVTDCEGVKEDEPSFVNVAEGVSCDMLIVGDLDGTLVLVLVMVRDCEPLVGGLGDSVLDTVTSSVSELELSPELVAVTDSDTDCVALSDFVNDSEGVLLTDGVREPMLTERVGVAVRVTVPLRAPGDNDKLRLADTA